MCFGHDPFEILQIVEATGWRAVYQQNGNLKQIPLVCFALVKHLEDEFSFVAGMNPVADDPVVIMPSDYDEEEDDNKFLGYIGPGESTDKFKDDKEDKRR